MSPPRSAYIDPPSEIRNFRSKAYRRGHWVNASAWLGDRVVPGPTRPVSGPGGSIPANSAIERGRHGSSAARLPRAASRSAAGSAASPSFRRSHASASSGVVGLPSTSGPRTASAIGTPATRERKRLGGPPPPSGGGAGGGPPTRTP